MKSRSLVPFLKRDSTHKARSDSPLGYYATRYVLKRRDISLPEARTEFSDLCGRLFLTENVNIFLLPHLPSLPYTESIRTQAFEKDRILTII